MKKIIILLSVLAIVSCKTTEIEQVQYRDNAKGLNGELFGELEKIGNNLRNQKSNFNNKTSVNLAIKEIYGNELVEKVEKLRLKRRKYKINQPNDFHSKNLKKVQELIIKSKNLRDYAFGLKELYSEVINNKKLKKDKKNRELNYLRTQITFAYYLNTNYDLFPVIGISKFRGRQSSSAPRPCGNNNDCESLGSDMVCYRGYCVPKSECGSFGRGELSAVWAVALVEPTPVGEVVATVVTAAVVVKVVVDKVIDVKYCIDKYNDCIEYSKYPNKCYDCFRYCTGQGIWRCE